MRPINVEEMAKRLKPILKKDIELLYLRYRLEPNPYRKKKLEQTIILLYQKHIDSVLDTDKVLLEPPAPELTKGDLDLGDVIYDDKVVGKFGLLKQEMLRHCGIFGQSGAGKSNVVFKLIDELITCGCNVFVYDWKKQYRDYLYYNLKSDVLVFGVGNKHIPCLQFNPLIPPKGLSPGLYLEHICHSVASAYYCGEGVISLLRGVISKLYTSFGVYDGTSEKYPTFLDVLQEMKSMKHQGRSKDWLQSTVRALEAICHGEFGKIVNVQQPTLDVAELLRHNVFLELGDLGKSQKKFIIQTLLTYFYYFTMNRGNRERLQNVLILEEAHHIVQDHAKTATGNEPISDIILKEIREFGVGVVIIDQNPSLISVPALANNFLTVGLYTKHAADISALSRAMFLSEDQKEYLGKLPKGYGIVKLAGRVYSPFLVKFHHMTTRKGMVSDTTVAHHMAKFGFLPGHIPGITDMLIERDLLIRSGEISPSLAPSLPPSKTAQSLINPLHAVGVNSPQGGATVPLCDSGIRDMLCKVEGDVERFPFDSMSKRSKRLRISWKKLNSCVDELINKKLIRKVTIQARGSSLHLLEFTKDSGRSGGIEHRYWNHRIAELNRKAGWKVELEKRIEGDGFIDQVVTHDKTTIAIEIETGKSDPIGTIQKNLTLGFDKIICVATNESTLESCKSAFPSKFTGNMISFVLAQDFQNFKF